MRKGSVTLSIFEIFDLTFLLEIPQISLYFFPVTK
jgi:hypothetical protein